MTTFCETCPLRPANNEEIKFGFVTNMRITQGPMEESIKVGLVADEHGNPSWPIHVPNDFSTVDLIKYILVKTDTCEGPSTKKEGIFRKREVVDKCTALGNLAVGDSIGMMATLHGTRVIDEHLLSEAMHATIAPLKEENQHDRTSD